MHGEETNFLYIIVPVALCPVEAFNVLLAIYELPGICELIGNMFVICELTENILK